MDRDCPGAIHNISVIPSGRETEAAKVNKVRLEPEAGASPAHEGVGGEARERGRSRLKATGSRKEWKGSQKERKGGEGSGRGSESTK